ncbi:MAG: outer membrane beta-barrel protein [Cyclobacteriaceae bacterium]
MKTFTNVIKTSVVALALFVAATASAQELTFSGSVDTYYRTNIGANYQEAPGSSFANQHGFALGMVNLVTGIEGENSGFVADLVFGPRGTDAVFGATTASSSIVNQLYAYWNVSESFTLTIGNFNTFLGYEVISPTANYNYSTSYMFSYGPFSHSGLKADISLGDASLMLGVFNPTDDTDYNPSGKYVFGAQLGYGGAYLNTILSDDFYQVDLTAGWDLTDALYFGVNATTAKDNFYGAALYLQNSFSDDFSLGIRGEYFSEEGVGALPDLTAVGGPAATNVIDLTASANYTVGSLTFIPEVRIDLYDEDVVNDGGTGSSSLASFVVAAVYAF